MPKIFLYFKNLGNHIVQYIVNNLQPQVYLKFIESLNKSVGLKQVVENKYGCRVLQCALEKVILICHQNNAQQRDATNKRFINVDFITQTS